MISMFKKSSVGLDIADRTIEIIELTGDKKIAGLARVRLKPGIVERGRIKDEKQLAKAVKEAFAKAKINTKEVVFGLPESQVYTLLLNSVEDLYRNIPLEKEDTVYSFKPVGEKQILLIASSKKVVREWQKFFATLNIEAVFDAESLATFRGLFTEPPEHPVCLVDMGAATTAISIFDKGELRYSYSMKTAGDVFTKEIARILNIPEKEAEDIKKDIGLSDQNHRIFAILTKLLQPIAQEIKVSLEHFKEKNGVETKEVILVGGSSQLKKVADYFKTNLEIPTRLGKSSLTSRRLYISAIGLAVRELDEKWKDDPRIHIAEEEAQKREVKPKPQTKIITPEGNKKLQKQKITLGILVAIGIVLVAGAFWYRSNEKTQQQAKLATQIIQYTKTQSFDLKIPVAVAAKEYTPDRAQGRILENTIQASGGYNEAVANSRRIAEKELEQQESLWFEPVSPEQTEFPMTIRWLVYSEQAANELFLKEVEKSNKEKVDFALNNIEKFGIEETDNPHIYYLNGKITLSLNELIKIEIERAPEIIEEEEETIKVIIQDTPTGFLNVREGPGFTFEVFTEVKPGENYILLRESGEWYNIQVDGETEGWVSSRYSGKNITE